MNPYVRAKAHAANGDTYRVFEFRDICWVQLREQGQRTFVTVDGDPDLDTAKQIMKAEVAWSDMQRKQGRRA